METKKETKVVELSPEQIRQNLEKLSKGVTEVYDLLKTIVPEAITEKEIKSFGNASHIVLPKEYEGKKAVVIIKK